MPDLDTLPLLDADQATFYQSQIGVLRWIVELGRIDIITEVSELSLFLMMLQERHLEALFNLFEYMEKWHNARIVFDPSYPVIDQQHAIFQECDWNSFYGDAKEALPTN